MIFVDNEKTYDARVNLAIEEYLLRNLFPDEDILLFYINEPSIIIGRNQNTIEEINTDYVEQHNIHVVRRLSGGGAVYHDKGNLNFSFIAKNSGDSFQNFRKFTAPVIEALNHLGVAAELSGRNDILVEGRKISGNAQYISGLKIVSHGTLLYNSDLSHVSDALKVKSSKIESKGIKSIRSRVANITEFLADPMNIEDFRQYLLKSIFKNDPQIPQYTLTAADWEAINQLSASRYQSWDWNYGRSPAFNIQKINRFPGGEVDARIFVEKGIIRQVKFYGDFFGQLDIAELESKLHNVQYAREELARALQDVSLDRFISGITVDEFINFLY